MFGLRNIWSKTFLGERLSGLRGTRRRSDGNERNAEASVLRALQVMARRSSPHKASTRASIARAISVLEASIMGLGQIQELIDECQDLCQSGLETQDAKKHALLATRYEEVINELNAVAQGYGHAGHHLIDDSSEMLEVDLTEPDHFTLRLPHINLTAGSRGLAMPKPTQVFESKEALEQFNRHLMLVRERLEKSAAIFNEHATDLAKRLALLLDGAYAEKYELAGGPTEPMSFVQRA